MMGLRCWALAVLVHLTAAAAHRAFAFYDRAGPHRVHSSTNITRGHSASSLHEMPPSNSTAEMTCDLVFFPASRAPEGGWPVYQFNCGTATKPHDYRETLEHIASHGFVAVANLMDVKPDETFPRIPKAEACLKAIQTGGLPVPVDGNSVVVGGHSGGGPSAAILAFRHGLAGFVGQHAAAIPHVNLPTQKVIKGITGAVLQMCGSNDTKPFCGCDAAKSGYYNRFRTTTPRMLVESPFGHDAALFAGGNKAEGGLVVAFLYHVLKRDNEARRALVEAGSRQGYTIDDELYIVK
jgi:hypothetical protein